MRRFVGRSKVTESREDSIGFTSYLVASEQLMVIKSCHVLF
jgi:hypothetical protein